MLIFSQKFCWQFHLVSSRTELVFQVCVLMILDFVRHLIRSQSSKIYASYLAANSSLT